MLHGQKVRIRKAFLVRTIDTIVTAVEAEGLASRGAFHPVPDDAVPRLGDGACAGTLLLVGNAGPGMWPVFAASEEANDGAPDALDRWSRRIVSRLAHTLDGAAHFPFGGPPWLPFIRWAQRAGSVYPSPIGPLVHPDYGPVARLPGRNRISRTSRPAPA